MKEPLYTLTPEEQSAVRELQTAVLIAKANADGFLIGLAKVHQLKGDMTLNADGTALVRPDDAV